MFIYGADFTDKRHFNGTKYSTCVELLENSGIMQFLQKRLNLSYICDILQTEMRRYLESINADMAKISVKNCHNASRTFENGGAALLRVSAVRCTNPTE